MSLKRSKSRNAAERREVWTQKFEGELKRECGGSASGPSLYINVTSGSLAGARRSYGTERRAVAAAEHRPSHSQRCHCS